MKYREWLVPGVLAILLIAITTGLRVAAAGEWYLPSFSEEDPPSLCPSGYVVKGIRCSGRYCDNKSLRCQRYRPKSPDYRWSGWFSEDRPSEERSKDEFVTGLACSGRYCDNLRIRFVKDRGLGQPRSCRWTAWFSEEQGYRECSSSRFVASLGCSGKYCDNIRLYCCRSQ